MSILTLISDTLVSPAAAGNIEYNGQFYGTDSNAARGQLQRITQATAVASTSGTSIDFTGIPAWAKRITLMFSGVSTNSSSNVQVQLGDAGGIETSGYLGTGSALGASTVSSALLTSGFPITTGGIATTVILQGSVIISYVGSNTWTSQGNVGTSDVARVYVHGSAKTLSDTLTQVRITTVNGTDTFDAGTINIMYEG